MVLIGTPPIVDLPSKTTCMPLTKPSRTLPQCTASCLRSMTLYVSPEPELPESTKLTPTPGTTRPAGNVHVGVVSASSAYTGVSKNTPVYTFVVMFAQLDVNGFSLPSATSIF